MIDNEIMVMYGSDSKSMVKTLLDKANVVSQLKTGIRIGIKPNLVLAKPSESGATTCPELVSGIVEFLQEYGFYDIKILEGSWIGDNTWRAYKVCGYEEISAKYNVPLVDLKRDEFVKYNFDEFSISVARSVIEVDYLINVPVLKAHCQTKITCALKNLKGCISDTEKRRFHTLGLHKPIAYLNKVLSSNLIVVDGIIGDLTFEEGGNPVHMNRVIIGSDPVLIDAYACELIGYNPEDVDYIMLADKLLVGNASISSAKITEINVNSFSEQKYKPTDKVRYLAKWIEDKDACSACYGSLLHALERLREMGILDKFTGRFIIGQGYKNNLHEGFGIGKCAIGALGHIPGCPPRAVDIVRGLKRLLD